MPKHSILSIAVIDSDGDSWSAPILIGSDVVIKARREQIEGWLAEMGGKRHVEHDATTWTLPFHHRRLALLTSHDVADSHTPNSEVFADALTILLGSNDLAGEIGLDADEDDPDDPATKALAVLERLGIL